VSTSVDLFFISGVQPFYMLVKKGLAILFTFDGALAVNIFVRNGYGKYHLYFL